MLTLHPITDLKSPAAKLKFTFFVNWVIRTVLMAKLQDTKQVTEVFDVASPFQGFT